MDKIIAVIPARYDSTRFPGKPLAHIMGKPMIQWVYERVKKSDTIVNVIVATDDRRIYDCVKDFGGNVCMTGECNSGTDRVYEAVKKLDFDVVINVQGDEPTIKSQEINELVDAFTDENVVMATLKKRITDLNDLSNANVVKVVCDLQDNALYFSRSQIPFNRNNANVAVYKHIGMYAYRKGFLSRFVELPESPNERIEKLEQLRALDNGYSIKVLETEYNNFGVDCPEDITKVEEILKKELENGEI